MIKKRVVLTFPHEVVSQPIVYHLVKDYNLMINILRARVTPQEQGRLVVEISGRKKELEAGMNYLAELNIDIQPLARDIKWHENKCIHCTACIPHCPTDAISLNRDTMKVSFDKQKCIACELCIPACPYQAIEIVI